MHMHSYEPDGHTKVSRQYSVSRQQQFVALAPSECYHLLWIQRAQETIAGIDNISLEQNIHSRWSAQTGKLGRARLGVCLELIIMDGCPGLWSAIDEVYPLVPHQLCTAFSGIPP